MNEDYKEEKDNELTKTHEFDSRDLDVLEMQHQVEEDLAMILDSIKDPAFRDIDIMQIFLRIIELDNCQIRRRLNDGTIIIHLMDCALNSFADQNFDFMALCFHCICILAIQTKMMIHSDVLKILLDIFNAIEPQYKDALEAVIEIIGITLNEHNIGLIPSDFYGACIALLEEHPDLIDTVGFFVIRIFEIVENKNIINGNSPVIKLAYNIIGNDRIPAKRAQMLMWLIINKIRTLQEEEISEIFFDIISNPIFDNYETIRIILNYMSLIDEEQVSYLYDDRFVLFIIHVLQIKESEAVDGRTVAIQNYAFKMLYRLIQIAPSSFPSFFIQSEYNLLNHVYDAMIHAPNKVRTIAGSFFGMLMNRFPAEMTENIKEAEDDDFIDSVIHMLAMDLDGATYHILAGLKSIAEFSETGKEILFKKGIIDIIAEAIDDMVNQDNIDTAQSLLELYDDKE